MGETYVVNKKPNNFNPRRKRLRHPRHRRVGTYRRYGWGSTHTYHCTLKGSHTSPTDSFNSLLSHRANEQYGSSKNSIKNEVLQSTHNTLILVIQCDTFLFIKLSSDNTAQSLKYINANLCKVMLVDGSLN